MSDQKYGFLNGVPIEPGEGWELVPMDAVIGKQNEMLIRIGWVPCVWAGYKVSEVIQGYGETVAFRRPKQTVQAENAPDLSGMIAIGRERQGIRTAGEINPARFKQHWESPLGDNHGLDSRPGDTWIDDPTKSAGDVRALIAQLRTLTAAQSVALEKAEEEVREWSQHNQNIIDDFNASNVSKDNAKRWLKSANNTLTLIQQAKDKL